MSFYRQHGCPPFAVYLHTCGSAPGRADACLLSGDPSKILYTSPRSSASIRLSGPRKAEDSDRYQSEPRHGAEKQAGGIKSLRAGLAILLNRDVVPEAQSFTICNLLFLSVDFSQKFLTESSALTLSISACSNAGANSSTSAAVSPTSALIAKERQPVTAPWTSAKRARASDSAK